MTYFSTIDSGYQSKPNEWVNFLNCVSKKNEYGTGNNLFEIKDEKYWLSIESEVRKISSSIESKIGKPLPKSYLHFLVVTEGIYKLSFEGPLPNSNFMPLTSIMTFHEDLKGDIEYWSDANRIGNDQEYYVYGVGADGHMKADPLRYVGSQVANLISVGYIDGDGFIALNPAEISKDGEWEAWYLDWRAVGVKRFRSFAELFQNIAHSKLKKNNKAPPYSSTDLKTSCASLLQTSALSD